MTDVDAVYEGWGTRSSVRSVARRRRLSRDRVRGGLDGAEGQGRVLVRRGDGGSQASIGSIADTPALLRGETGTLVTRDAEGLELADVA